MSKIELPQGEFSCPVPVVLVSCLDKDINKPNIITIAWCGVVCSNPPQLSISIRPSRYSHKLIKDSGNFAINIPTMEMIKKVDLCGVRSGKDTDKFELCGFTAMPSSKISSPIIEECPVNMECGLKEIVKLGSHDMFIGEVLALHADEEILKDGKIDLRMTKPFVYDQGKYWNLGVQIGYYGFSSK